MSSDLKEIVQRGLCKMNREQANDPCCIWHEIEQALLMCGDHFGCDLNARWEYEVRSKSEAI